MFKTIAKMGRGSARLKASEYLNRHGAPPPLWLKFVGSFEYLKEAYDLVDFLKKELERIEHLSEVPVALQRNIALHIADVVPALKRLKIIKPARHEPKISRNGEQLSWKEISPAETIAWSHLYFTREYYDGPQKLKQKFTVGEALAFLREEEAVLLTGETKKLPTPKRRDVKVGARLEDGTVYGGVVPSTGKPLRILGEDEGRTAGKFINATMSFNAAVKQALRASELSGNLSLRLPTPEEMDVLYQNRAAIGTFNVERADGAELYWTQDKIDDKALTAPVVRFTDGKAMNRLKVKKATVRLVVAR